eukprot:SAG31_NODE_1444_length_8321_cov_2.478716_5_plen_133_part_00
MQLQTSAAAIVKRKSSDLEPSWQEKERAYVATKTTAVSKKSRYAPNQPPEQVHGVTPKQTERQCSMSPVFALQSPKDVDTADKQPGGAQTSSAIPGEKTSVISVAPKLDNAVEDFDDGIDWTAVDLDSLVSQ